MVWAAVAALACGLSPATALAGDSVHGTGVITSSRGAADGENFYVQVAVNAYSDDDGVPQGHISWEGDVSQFLPMGNVGAGPNRRLPLGLGHGLGRLLVPNDILRIPQTRCGRSISCLMVGQTTFVWVR
jgi:hypothetical protein